MYSKILIATDGSELADKSLQQGLALAAKLAAEAVIVTVSEPWQGADAGQVWSGSASVLEEYRNHRKDTAEKVLSAASERAQALAVRHQTVYVPDRYPAEAILDTAVTQGADLIVMATHGRRGLNRLLLGSQANAVISHSTVPVLVVR